MRSSKLRRWKESADDAILPAHFGRERHTLTREIGARLFTSMGLPAGKEERIGALLNDSVLRISLASRYVAGLQESMTAADYEDAAVLARQAAWAKAYLEEQVLCPLLVAADDEMPLPGHYTLDPLYTTLTRLLASQLSEADEAAA